jgi:hypothetical protein
MAKDVKTLKHQTAKLLQDSDDLRSRIQVLSEDIKEVTSLAKRKYDEIDPVTRKKIAIGIGSLAALIAGGMIAKGVRNRDK